MSKRRVLSIHQVLRILLSKRCKVEEDQITKTQCLNISKAENLGNKSWGYIDFLEKEGMPIVGKVDYKNRSRSLVKSNDKKKKEKKTSVSELIAEKNNEAISYSKHSYDGIPSKSDKGYKYSEFNRLVEINHFASKFVKGFSTSPSYKKAHRKLIKKAKKSIDIKFGNQVIFSSEHLHPLKQRKHNV